MSGKLRAESVLLSALLLCGVAGCGSATEQAASTQQQSAAAVEVAAEAAGAVDTETEPGAVPADGNCSNYSATGTALFGDLHVHTSYSFDAAANSTGATPADAHRAMRVAKRFRSFPLAMMANRWGLHRSIGHSTFWRSPIMANFLASGRCVTPRVHRCTTRHSALRCARISGAA